MSLCLSLSSDQWWFSRVVRLATRWLLQYHIHTYRVQRINSRTERNYPLSSSLLVQQQKKLNTLYFPCFIFRYNVYSTYFIKHNKAKQVIHFFTDVLYVLQAPRTFVGPFRLLSVSPPLSLSLFLSSCSSR